MKCPKCDFDNREGVKFCEGCGVKLELICPECSATIPPDRRFCGECGHDLRKPKEAPAIDYQLPRSYTPKHLADKILSNRIAIEGERKLVTVLFADVANSTAMFENLDPEQVHEIMDGCFRILMDEIHRHEGTINQFTGDGVMALFGAPIAHEDHAQRACYAALAIQKALRPYNERLKREHNVDFTMRIGLNSGPVVVGSIGDDLRMDYTALGDTANLAARMESNAEPGNVLVSKHTYKLARGFFDFESLGEIQVKGKAEPVQTYQLVKASKVATRIEASAAKGLTRFVGRKREIETLKEAFEKAQLGEGQVVGVVGEAGVGKSRLLLEFRNSLPKGEYIYLEGLCLHYGSSMPYLPILDAFRTYLGIKEGENESVIKQKMKERIVGSDERLTRCLPPIQELFSIKVDDEGFTKLEPKQKREKTFEAIRDILIRGSQTRPIVMAIEDLHWIDKTTEEFLDYMIGWLPGARILLILLYRPEYIHRWGSKSYYGKIGVGQLSSNTSAELVQAILEGGAVVPELRELILSRAAGNPLFMEELTHSLLENGSVQKEADQYILVRNASEIQVPETIQGIIAARMDRLEESLKRIMQVASVIGREFAFRILHAITEMKEDLKSNLLNLQGLEFIYEKSLFPDLEYIFKHALTQEVAYNSLLQKRRKEIHERIGRAIEELYTDRLEEFYEMLAHQFSKSDNGEKAFHYLKLSGNKAMRNHALREAFRCYNEALTVMKQAAESEQANRKSLDVLHLLTTPMALLGYPEDSLQALEEGVALSARLGDQKSIVTFHSRIGHYHFARGNPMIGIDYGEQCFRESEEMREMDLIVATGNELCASYSRVGNYLGVIDVAPKIINAIELVRREPDFFGRPFNVYVDMHGYYAVGTGALGDFEAARAVSDKGLAFAMKINHLPSLSWMELCCTYVNHLLGDGQSVLEHSHNTIAYSDASEITMLSGLGWMSSGIGYHLLGELEKAENHIRRGLCIQNEVGLQTYLPLHYIALSSVLFDKGNYEEAEGIVQKALALSVGNYEREHEGVSLLLLGRILGRRQGISLDKAKHPILRGIALLEELRLKPHYAKGYLFLGELEAEAEDKNRPLESLKKAESMFREMGMDYWLGKTHEVLARL